MLYKSSGIIRCYKLDNSTFKMIILIDKDLSNYYFSMIPKYFYVQRQKYPSHITIVRNEYVEDKKLFWSYNNKIVSFIYDNEIKNDHVYWWLDVFCDELYDIRLSLGLKKSYRSSRPPDNKECFHTTIGNMKRDLVLNLKNFS